jgi:hypothetical protein
MLTFPFRILATIAVVLFCSSRLVRRAVAGIAVSALIVAAQHEDLLTSALLASGDHATLGSTLRALMGLVSG